MGKQKQKRRVVVLEPDAAGIDIGAEEIYVAVPPDRDEESTRKFSTFTCDLNALAEVLAPDCVLLMGVVAEPWRPLSPSAVGNPQDLWLWRLDRIERPLDMPPFEWIPQDAENK
jgi:hypothetical protein